MSGAPEILERPDVSPEALQALRGDFLYFNVAGSGPTFPIAQRAASAFRAWQDEVGMFSHVGYDAYNAALADARRDLAAALGDDDGAERVALAQSATDALNTLSAGLQIPRGSLIVTTAEEHGSALLPLFRRQERGDRLRVLPYRDDGSFLRAVAEALGDGARAVQLSLVSCRSGKVLPVAQTCALAREAGAVSIVDVAQAFGQIPVDVHELRADAVAFLGHKWLHGPLATGGMWVADPERFSVERLGWRSVTAHDMEGGYTLKPDASRFEIGTADAGAFVGLRQALAVHRMLGARVDAKVRALRARLIGLLARLPFDLLSRPEDPTGIVVVVPHGGDAAGIVTRMWTEERIVVKLLEDPVRALRAQGPPLGIRISFWALHSEDDIDRLAAALERQVAVAA